METSSHPQPNLNTTGIVPKHYLNFPKRRWLSSRALYVVPYASGVMPIPQPGDSESHGEFVGRCVGDETMISEYPDQDQRSAVCFSTWRSAKREDNVKDEHYQRAPSHAVEVLGDIVTIRGLELFVGFDESIDDPDDKRLKKYDQTAVQRVVDRTRQYMDRGQSPKLILGHNKEDSDYTKPSIGDIVSVRMEMIGDVPGIVGDVEMSVQNFQEYLKSNSYPRRSAEIWVDGFLSEVALLGSETPARPIPDTRFTRASVKVGERDRATVDQFAREYAATFAEPTTTMHGPGPGNVHIPDARKDDMSEHDDETIKKLKAQLDEITKDRDALKSKLSKFQADSDDDKKKAEENSRRAANEKKDVGVRVTELEAKVEQFKKSDEAKATQLASLGEKFIRERADNQIELMAQQGYRIGNGDDHKELVDRIVASKDPDAELEFWKKRLPRDNPIGVIIDQSHTVGLEGAGDKQLTLEQRTKAADAAFDRCTAEKKPEMYSRYLSEEQAKVA